jgi:hypothetical protein
VRFRSQKDVVLAGNVGAFGLYALLACRAFGAALPLTVRAYTPPVRLMERLADTPGEFRLMVSSDEGEVIAVYRPWRCLCSDSRSPSRAVVAELAPLSPGRAHPGRGPQALGVRASTRRL